MAVSNEQFLFCCIDHSNNGAVNWQAVADACGIPSKGAASIKYRRMKDKFGTISDADTDTKVDGEGEAAEGGETPKKPKKKPAKKAAAGDDAAEDDEEPKKTKKAPAKKATNKKRKLEEEADDAEDNPVKDEEEEE